MYGQAKIAPQSPDLVQLIADDKVGNFLLISVRIHA
jgi:hypothetical protein